ncbi:MAG: PIN domain-containing protein [Actinomycetes bacterium]
MIILDTSVLLAFLWAPDPEHERAAALLAQEMGPLVVSPYVLAELDYLLLRQGGVGLELVAIEELADGAYELPTMGAADLLSCLTILSDYREHSIGVTDASLVVLAERYGTTRIATLDHRHFSMLRSLDGKPFTLLP